MVSIDDLRAMVEIAVNNNLSLLEIGDVKIIPNPVKTPQPTLQILDEAERKKGKPLTDQEKADEVLFGPGGSLRVDDDVE